MNSYDAFHDVCMVKFHRGNSQDVSYIQNTPDEQRSGVTLERFVCCNCGKVYRWKNTLYRHLRLECGKEPQFHCPHCPYRAKRKGNLQKHVAIRHRTTEWNFDPHLLFMICLNQECISLIFCGPYIMIYLQNKDQPVALFSLNLFRKSYSTCFE
jgi:hypothetical protein